MPPVLVVVFVLVAGCFFEHGASQNSANPFRRLLFPGRVDQWHRRDSAKSLGVFDNIRHSLAARVLFLVGGFAVTELSEACSASLRATFRPSALSISDTRRKLAFAPLARHFDSSAHPNILNFAITHSSAIAAADQNKDLPMANLGVPNPFNAHWSPIPLYRRYQVVPHFRKRCTDTGKAAGDDWDVHWSAPDSAGLAKALIDLTTFKICCA